MGTGRLLRNRGSRTDHGDRRDERSGGADFVVQDSVVDAGITAKVDRRAGIRELPCTAFGDLDVDVLIELGERYALRGDRTSAAASYRQAQAIADDEMPHVAAAIGRLSTPRPSEHG